VSTWCYLRFEPRLVGAATVDAECRTTANCRTGRWYRDSSVRSENIRWNLAGLEIQAQLGGTTIESLPTARPHDACGLRR